MALLCKRLFVNAFIERAFLFSLCPFDQNTTIFMIYEAGKGLYKVHGRCFYAFYTHTHTFSLSLLLILFEFHH